MFKTLFQSETVGFSLNLAAKLTAKEMSGLVHLER